MENILAQELELQHKLHKLEVRHQKLKSQSKYLDLTKISTPENIAAIAKSRREMAMTRNAELLSDLNIASSKLHTKNMCPLESKLDKMKQKFLQECDYNRKLKTDPDFV
ncbi:uncharacterized protein LOC110849421 [Folsomia candida]|uniref:Uncharacterized protein n=1 Tax=Folsomia candida TaxID=158441 RepID=A0A226EF44_FOLCA|nr:uncharacterized protein LOC110849421 [Folsomia candida]OXA55441.1 hypothetical protein Fcan01_09975 [Folsomia candida]